MLYWIIGVRQNWRANLKTSPISPVLKPLLTGTCCATNPQQITVMEFGLS